MKKLRSKYGLIVLLAIIFILPGPMAYIFYKHPEWLTALGTNKGELLNPPVLFRPLGEEPKWAMLVWHPITCDNQCEQELDKLTRVRLALGRRLYEVDTWLVLGHNAKPLDAKSAQFMKEHQVRVLYLESHDRADEEKLNPTGAVYIANPDDYLVLYYKASVKPADVYHDIKQLLKGSNPGAF